MDDSNAQNDQSLSKALSDFLRAEGPDSVTRCLMHEGIEFQIFYGGDKRYPHRIPDDRKGEKGGPFPNQQLRAMPSPSVESVRNIVTEIGVTGWNWRDRQTEFIIMDYDSGERASGCEDTTLQAIQDAATELGWVWVRHSRGGKGIHLIVVLDKSMPAQTGNQHKANANAIIDRMAADSGFDFSGPLDCGGVVGYVYPSKSEDGFKELVQPTKETPAFEVPAPSDGFDELTAYPPCELDGQHRADIRKMKAAGYVALWEKDAKRLLCHSKAFEVLNRPGYSTNSLGKHPTEPNGFAYPTPDGGWVVNRFNVGPDAEADCWFANKEGHAMARIDPPEGKKDKIDPKVSLFNIAKRNTLCCTPERVPVVIGQFNGKHRTFILPDAELEGIMARELLQTAGVIPTGGQLRDAMRVVEATAIQGEQRSIYTRVGPHEDDLYVDLGDETQRVIRITKKGWSVVNDSPILFHRSPNITPMPEPARGGQLDLMRGFLNVQPEQWPVVVAFLLGTWNPYGDYPILFLHGQAESGKSTIARHIQAIVDPHWDANSQREDLFAPPKNEEDLMITALHTRLIGYDNLTGVGKWLHPALCRLSTGGASIARRLYTNSGMVKMSATRPVMITSVHDIMNRAELQDLRSRALIMPCIKPPATSKPPQWRDYELVRPQILGSVCDAVSCALANYEETAPLQGSRLPDFTRFAMAAEPATGLPSGTIGAALQANRSDSAEEVLANPVAAAVRGLAEEGFVGSAKDMLARLRADSVVDLPEGTGHGAATIMGNLLTEMATEQSKVGVLVKKRKDRKWEIKRLQPSETSCNLGA